MGKDLELWQSEKAVATLASLGKPQLWQSSQGGGADPKRCHSSKSLIGHALHFKCGK
jgi:hypothetical protein